jgi:hypothetical protein
MELTTAVSGRCNELYRHHLCLARFTAHATSASRGALDEGKTTNLCMQIAVTLLGRLRRYAGL